jgi:hypothetical protein
MTRINWKEEFTTILAIEAMSARDRNVVEDIKKGYDRRGSSYLSSGRKSYLAGIKERSLRQETAREERQTLGETVMAQRLASLSKFIVDKSSWASGVIESFAKQEANGRVLTVRQIILLEKVELEHNASTAAEEISWTENFTNNKDAVQSNWSLAMYYYKANAPYFQGHVRNWFRNEDGKSAPTPKGWGAEVSSEKIPNLREYKKVIDNKFVQKVLTAWNAEPAFANGTYVALRSNAPVGKCRINFKTSGVVIKSNSSTPTSSARGSKLYQVLPFGAAVLVEVEERYLKTAKIK